MIANITVINTTVIPAKPLLRCGAGFSMFRRTAEVPGQARDDNTIIMDDGAKN